MPRTCEEIDGTSPKTVGSDPFENFRFLAEPISRQEKVRAIIERAARAVRFEYWRAYEIWYDRAKLTIEERDAITAAAEAKERKERRNEYFELKARLARLESRLVQTDADFHREDISALRGSARGRG